MRPTRTRNPLRLLVLLAAIALFVTLPTGCSSDDGGGGGTSGAGGGGGGGGANEGSVTGTLAVSVDGANVTLDYTAGTAQVSLAHKLAPDDASFACIGGFGLVLSEPDGTCRLELDFVPSGAGKFTVSGAAFFANKADKSGDVVLQTTPCAGWPETSETEELVWQLAGGSATVDAGIIAPPEGSKAEATITDRTFDPQGTIKLARKGKQFSLDLRPLTVSGTFTSVGSANVSCGSAIGPSQCGEPQTEGNDVGMALPRTGLAASCADDAAFDLQELCGHDAIVVSIYRRWSEKACGGCPAEQTCTRVYTSETSYLPTCAAPSDGCGGCASGEVCVSGEGGDECRQAVADGDDRALADALDGYAQIVTGVAPGDSVAHVLVVAEGAERARGVCEETGPGQLSCDGSGPAASPADCDAVKSALSLPDDVVLLYDQAKEMWTADGRIGPNTTNGMVILDGQLTIRAVFPVQGQPPPAPSDVLSAIQAVIDG